MTTGVPPAVNVPVVPFIAFLPAPPLDPPSTLNVGDLSARSKRGSPVAPQRNLSPDRSEASVLSDDFLVTPGDLDADAVDTPDDADSLEFFGNGNELEWEGQYRGRDVVAGMVTTAQSVEGARHYIIEI